MQPLWETWAALVRPEAQEMLQALQRNHEWYRQRIAPQPGNDPPQGGNTPPMESSSELS